MRKEWYSPAEAAAYLGGYGDRFVRRQIELGRLRSHVFDAGGRPTHKIYCDDLEAFKARYIRTIGPEPRSRAREPGGSA